VRPLRTSPPAAATFRPRLEGLEDRRLLSGINEFQTPTVNSGPHGITTGADGNLWFTEQNVNHIGRITPTGSITEFVVPTPGSSPTDITRGPDGNLWFTEGAVGVGKIGQLTTGGVFTEFTVPPTMSGNSSITPTVMGITTGSDGNLWFTEFNTGKIGRITPAGVITEFPLPVSTNGPFEITSGPDGNLWFTEQTAGQIAGQIGRISPGGSNAITEFAPPSGLVANTPYGITSGPDGNVWFTESGSNHIGKITPSGIVTVFSVPTASSNPHGIVLGSDGNLWFTESNTSKIGQVTTAGVFQEFAVPTSNSAPTLVTLGPDGNLWFTEFSIPGHIGQLILPHYIVTGSDAGGLPEVKEFDARTGTVLRDFMAYDTQFLGGVRVALGDVNHDGVPDIITAPGPEGGPDIRVFDGVTGNLIHEFMAFSPLFLGGVNVATGDFNADGWGDIYVAADAGGGPEVKVYSGQNTNNILYDAQVYDSRFRGGVRVAAADVEETGHADIIVAPGVSGGPDIRVISGITSKIVQEFLAYPATFLGGEYVAGGDTNGDGHADIIVGPGSGAPNVKVFSGVNDAVLQTFDAYNPIFLGGVRVGALNDFNGTNRYDILTGAGPQGGPQATVFDGMTLAQLDSFYAYSPSQTTGIFVGGR
jgi:streptogramin lyase